MRVQPTRKVAWGPAGGAVSVIIVWLLGQFSIAVPAEVAVAIGSVATFVIQWFVRDFK